MLSTILREIIDADDAVKLAEHALLEARARLKRAKSDARVHPRLKDGHTYFAGHVFYIDRADDIPLSVHAAHHVTPTTMPRATDTDAEGSDF